MPKIEKEVKVTLIVGVGVGTLLGLLLGVPLWILGAAAILTALTWIYIVIPGGEGLSALNNLIFLQERAREDRIARKVAAEIKSTTRRSRSNITS